MTQNSSCPGLLPPQNLTDREGTLFRVINCGNSQYFGFSEPIEAVSAIFDLNLDDIPEIALGIPTANGMKSETRD